MDPIGSFSGIASGIQWRDMVDQITSVERARRVVPLQQQQSTNLSRTQAWSTYQSLVNKLGTAARALQNGSAFNRSAVTGGTTPAGRALFAASATADAAPGTYRIEVQELARAEKIGGARAFEATNQPLGAAGDFWINGRRMEIGAGDTLASVRDRINDANRGTNPSGVSATILLTGPNEHRLVLTSAHTGSRGIEMVDGAGGPLAALGIGSGDVAENRSPGGALQTQRFDSRTSSLASMLGLTAPPETREVQINGVTVTVNLHEDSLQSLQQKIQQQLDLQPDPRPQARIIEEQVGGRTMFRLDVPGPAQQRDPASEDVLQHLGFLQAARADGAQFTAGADARLTVDGFVVSRRTNVVSGVIPGVTLNLQTSEPGTVLDLQVTRDLGAAVGAVKEFTAAYNEIRSFVDKQSAPGQPLASNGTLRSTLSQLTSVLFADVGGLPSGSQFTRGALVGVALSKTGTLDVNEAALRSALDASPADVRALFATSGSTVGAGLEFLSAGAKATAGSYDVQISALATRAAGTGTVQIPASYASVGGPGNPDTLSIRDTISGRTLDLQIEDGQTLQQIVDGLNARFSSENMRLTAERTADNELRIVSTEFGSAGAFSVSGTAAQPLGFAEGFEVTGTDVQGTIGGQPAQGRGQTLTGAAGSPAEGIAVRYTGVDTGSAGSVRHAAGLGGMMSRVTDLVGRAGDGTVATQIDSLRGTSDSLTRRIEAAEARMEQRRLSMIQQFSRMEAAMAKVQAQGNWLSSQIRSMQPQQR